MKCAPLLREATTIRTIIHGRDYHECARLEGISKRAVEQSLYYLVHTGFLRRISTGVYRRQ